MMKIFTIYNGCNLINFPVNLIMNNIKIGVIGCNSFSGASFVDFALTSNLSVIGISRS